jgi:hypothetical protein
MQLSTVATELTTAATDGILAVLAVACIAVLTIRCRHHDSTRQLLWSSVFLLLAIGATLGTVVHGLQLPQVVRFWVWQPLFLSIGLVVSLLVVVAAVDLLGKKVLRPVLWVMLSATLGFYLCTLLGNKSYWMFVAYETVCMVIVLASYSCLAARGNQGATLLVIGISLSITAATIQASQAIAMTVGPWLLDHNGVFHLVQMPALILLALGARWFDLCNVRRCPDA